jgi:hypothetical protein
MAASAIGTIRLLPLLGLCRLSLRMNTGLNNVEHRRYMPDAAAEHPEPCAGARRQPQCHAGAHFVRAAGRSEGPPTQQQPLRLAAALHAGAHDGPAAAARVPHCSPTAHL